VSSARDPDFLEDWDVQGYLDEYYGYAEVPPYSRSLLRFLIGNLQRIDRTFPSALDFGCGPALIHAAALAPWVRRLDMADLQPRNLEAIERWLRADPAAFDWSTYIAGAGGVLDQEGRSATQASREALMRRIIRTRAGDITRELPLGEPASFALVGSFFCLEWVVPTTEAWRVHAARLASMLEPGGWMFMGVLHDGEGLMIGARPYRAARVSEATVRDLLLEQGFRPDTIRLELGAPCLEEGQPPHRDLLVCAQKR
jgi:SAM-dependent methyltransferase